ncbi:MAG: polyphosphate kinase 1 [Anaerovoracaceae bacterium]
MSEDFEVKTYADDDEPAEEEILDNSADSSEAGELDYTYTQNRELSWLNFNRRVLEEAAFDRVPALERLKFVSIFTSNMDEFFMVRVGSLFDLSQVSPDKIDNKTGWTPEEQLKAIYKEIPGLIERKDEIYASVMAKLAEDGIVDVDYDALTEAERVDIDAYFETEVQPILSPIVIGTHHPMPHLMNKCLYIAALMEKSNGSARIGLVQVPATLPPIIMLGKGTCRYIRIEELIRSKVDEIFPGYKGQESCVIAATRNADIKFDDEKFEDEEVDFRDKVSTLLKKRKTLAIMRLEMDRPVSKEFLSRMLKQVKVKNRQIYIDKAPLSLKFAFGLAKKIPEDLASKLTYRPYQPQWPITIDKNRKIADQVLEGDKMLFYPYDSVEPFMRFLTEAADDPDVISIKITIYRLSDTSRIARILCRAAENGKEVIAIMELRARFDEANNIAWSKVMEDSGCKIFYGIDNYKCHGKICLITRRSHGRLSYMTQIGTGNYNEKTNAQYTDLCYLTSDPVIGEAGNQFFRNMMISDLDGEYNRIFTSPHGITPMLIRNIRAQRALGNKGYVCIKANGVTDREIIDELRDASKDGVEIHLIIRGICCIKPGVQGETENIHVKRIVGRYLEHARIYCFGRGDEAEYYISSADLMTRNLRRRVEVACHIEDQTLKKQLRWILDTQLKDRSEWGGFSSQDEFMKHSIHDLAVETPVEHIKEIHEKHEKRRRGFFARLFGLGK